MEINDEISAEEAEKLMKENFPDKFNELIGQEQQSQEEQKPAETKTETQTAKTEVEQEEQKETSETTSEQKPQYVNPFDEKPKEEKPADPSQEVVQLKAQVEELTAELQSYDELLNDEYIKFALEAKESGKSFFEAVDELRPKSINDLTVEEIFEEQLKRYSKLDKWTEEEIEEERKQFEDMKKSQKRDYVSAFAKELEAEFSAKKTEFKFDAKKEILSQKELKKAETRVVNEIANTITTEVDRLVKSGYLPQEQTQDFYNEINQAKDWIEFSPEGIPKPNTKMMLEYAWLKRTFNQKIEEAKAAGKQEALLQEKVNKTNTVERVVTKVENGITQEEIDAAIRAEERY